jgi:hypothetical protein
VRFAELWLANSLSRVRLVAARRPAEPGGNPEPVTDGPAAELVARLAGGVGGQAALNRAFATQLLTPGIGFLVGEPGPQGTDRWGVYSAEQLRLSQHPDQQSGERTYELREGPDATTDWRPLPAGVKPVKVWRPHPRWSWVPDSPVRGALPILRELRLLTQHVEASATSRLAGAGILAFDSTVEFPQGWEKWVEEFLGSVVKPIKNRASAAAYAPFPVRIPGPVKDKIFHLMFNTPFDEHALKLRDEAIGRLATAMDMPKHALTGEQENHWGKWATTEEGITLHVEPNMELICDGLTTGYLRPGLSVMSGRRSREVVTRNDEQRVRVLRPEPEAGDADLIVWYDTSDLRVRPDRSADTQAAWDRWEASGDDLRREAGITEAKPPEGQELERRVWLGMLDSDLAPLALVKLGLATQDEIDAARPPEPLPEPDDEDEPEDEPEAPEGNRALPPTRTAPAPETDEPAAAQLHPGLTLVAAADGCVHRALEKAGNRIRNLTARQRAADPARFDRPPHLMHTVLNASRLRPLDYWLDGVWDRVPELAEALGVDAAWLTAELDGYTRQLVRTQQPHSWSTLADYLSGPSVANVG